MYVIKEEDSIKKFDGFKFEKNEERYERKVRYGVYFGSSTNPFEMEKNGHIEVSFVGNARDCNHFGDGLEPFLKEALVLYDRKVMNNNGIVHNDYEPFGCLDCLPMVPDENDFSKK